MRNLSTYIVAIVSFVIVLAVIYYFSDIVAYVLIAWVLSLIGEPIKRFYRRLFKVSKWQIGNTTSAALTLMTFIFIFGTLISLFVPRVLQQARNLSEIDYENVVEGLEEPINDWNNWFIKEGWIEGDLVDENGEIIQDTLSQKGQEVTPEKNIYSHTTVAIDSILRVSGDTITKTNITLNINLDETIDLSNGDAAAHEIKDTDSPMDRIQKNIFSWFDPSQITTWFSSIIGFLGNLLIAIVSILFITFFFLKEEKLFVNFLEILVPDEYDDKMFRAVDDIIKLLTRYFGGIMIQVTIITLFVSVALGLLGIQNALLIGFFAALINVIPYVGPAMGAIFGVFIVISSNLGMPFYEEMLPLIFKVIGVFATMQMMDNFMLQPYIFSNSVQAHPLEIFIIILVGAKLGGVVGMILAIPVYTVLRVVARAFLSEFEVIKRLTDSLDEST